MEGEINLVQVRSGKINLSEFISVEFRLTCCVMLGQGWSG